MIGYENLRKPYIAAAISAAMADRAQRTQVDQDRVVLELARLGFSSIKQIYDEEGNLRPIHELPDEVAAAISSVKVRFEDDGETQVQVKEIRFWDKNSALEKLGKHLKMFTDKIEQSGPSGGPIEVSLKAYLDEIQGTTRGLPDAKREKSECPTD